MEKVTLLIAMAALVMFAGCKKENETKGTTLKASIEQHKGDGSKTSLNPTDGAIYWMAGDKILVNNGTESKPFSLTAGAGGTNGTFTYAGEFEINDDTKAVYPETGVVTESGVTFTLPEEQDLAAPGTFANGANPMVGIKIGDGLTFTSVCGGLGLSLTGDDIDITAIEIVSENEMLNGDYTGYFNNSNVNLTNGTDRVRLNCATTLTAEAKEFYIVLPVGTLGNGFTLNIYNGTADPIFTKPSTTDLTMEANTVKMMNTLEVTTTPAPTVPEGAVNGLFTINEAGTQVYFSQGNLQYQASTNTWQFAEHQYDYVGSANSSISQTNSGWIDLFGWGTSGYNHGAVCYQPWSTSDSYSDYWVYGQFYYNLYDGNGQADWGYNAIANGGNTENSGWRTLTDPEWDYVFNTRSTTSDIRWVQATVNSVNGTILLPDNWTASIYALNNTNGGSYGSNTITAEDWANTLEANGAVFLPAAGDRYGTSVYVDGFGGCFGGYYWSSSYNYSSRAYGVYIDSGYLLTNLYSGRQHGLSVRLVRSCQ